MAFNLQIRADVVDIRQDTPQPSDVFFVDTNVWFWQTYTNAGSSAKTYQIRDYPRYLTKVLSSGASLIYSGLSLAELAHLIERTEREIFNQLNSTQIRPKDFRHDYPSERSNVVKEVQLAWAQVKSIAACASIEVNETTTDSVLARFATQALDGYDLLMLEAIARTSSPKIQVLTDDSDYAVVPGIQLFTSNKRVIQAAKAQGRLVTR